MENTSHGLRFRGRTPTEAETHGGECVILAPTDQTEDSDFDDDLPAYAAVSYHDDPDKYRRNEQKPLTLQTFVAAQRADAHCRHLAEKVDTPDSPCFYDEFDTLTRRLRLDGVIQKNCAAVPKNRGTERRTRIDNIRSSRRNTYVRYNATVLLLATYGE